MLTPYLSLASVLILVSLPIAGTAQESLVTVPIFVSTSPVSFEDLEQGICHEGGRYSKVEVQSSGVAAILQVFASPGSTQVNAKGAISDSDEFLDFPKEYNEQNGQVFSFFEYIIVPSRPAIFHLCDFPTDRGFTSTQSAYEYQFLFDHAVSLNNELLKEYDLSTLSFEKPFLLRHETVRSAFLYGRLFNKHQFSYEINSNGTSQYSLIGPGSLNFRQQLLSRLSSHSNSVDDYVEALQLRVEELSIEIETLEKACRSCGQPGNSSTEGSVVNNSTTGPYIISGGSCGGGPFGQRFLLKNSNASRSYSVTVIKSFKNYNQRQREQTVYELPAGGEINLGCSDEYGVLNSWDRTYWEITGVQ